jgi:O-antigen/teichoic acid export membrane protein
MTTEIAIDTPLPAHALAPVPVETIRLRYAITLFTQFLQLGFSVITAGIVPKALGPVAFGNYNFLLSISGSVRNFTDLGAQQSFFTFSSKQERSGSLTRLYGAWLLIQLVLSVGLIGLLKMAGKTQWLWPGQQHGDILLMTVLDWAVFLSLTLRQLGDSKGLTVKTQIIFAMTTLLNGLGVVLLAWAGRLNLYSYAAYLLSVTCLSAVALAIYLLRFKRPACWEGRVADGAAENIQKWRVFASPLIVFGLYSTLVSALDTYLIQRLYGASEQAFFAIAMRWSSLVLVFTTSILAIYWRELAHALSSHRPDRAKGLFIRFNHILFFLSAFLGVWLCSNASFIILKIVGPQYRTAVPVLMIMAFYPVQQTFGQLNGAAFMASERTAQYRDLGIYLSMPSLALTYFLLAPRTGTLPGLGLGALGVAIKMVVYGLMSVQVYEWFNMRFFHASYGEAAAKKAITLAFVGSCAVIAFVGAGGFFRAHGAGDTAELLLTSALYCGLGFLGALRWPTLAGVQKSDWQSIVRSLGFRWPR